MPVSVNSFGKAPISFSDAGEQFEGLDNLDSTVNQFSIDQAVLEEAPLPHQMEKKKSARSTKATLMPTMIKHNSDTSRIQVFAPAVMVNTLERPSTTSHNTFD